MQVFALVNVFCFSATALRMQSAPTDISVDKKVDGVSLPPSATIRRISLEEEETIAKTAHVFVINLDTRKDKCKCMQSTLSNTSFPLFRHRAATVKDWHELCPDLRQQTHNPQSALFCSNYLIWQKMNEIKDKPDTPPYFIVIEDDVALSSSWEHEVMQMLSSNCTDLDWDFIRVDTFYQGFRGHRATCGANNHITMRRGNAAGTHMVIYRTKNVPNLLNFRATRKADDAYGNLRFWDPHIVSQMTKAGSHAQQTADGCSQSVRRSDIGFEQTNMIIERNMRRTLPCD